VWKKEVEVELVRCRGSRRVRQPTTRGCSTRNIACKPRCHATHTASSHFSQFVTHALFASTNRQPCLRRTPCYSGKRSSPQGCPTIEIIAFGLKIRKTVMLRSRSDTGPIIRPNSVDARILLNLVNLGGLGSLCRPKSFRTGRGFSL
jgi:hypothetical protein